MSHGRRPGWRELFAGAEDGSSVSGGISSTPGSSIIGSSIDDILGKSMVGFYKLFARLVSLLLNEISHRLVLSKIQRFRASFRKSFDLY